MELLRSLGRLVAAGAIFSFIPAAWAQQATEAAIKAAFLYKFAGYIEWPATAFAGPDTPLVIATLSADDVAAELETTVAGRTVGNRRIVVRRLREGEPLQGVHVLFIGRREPNPRLALRAAHQAGALTVTETTLDAGGAINFVLADERVAFEVSLDAAERSGHRISSRMLTVARRVVPKGAS
jgi:hypothetical protein